MNDELATKTSSLPQRAIGTADRPGIARLPTTVAKVIAEDHGSE